MLNTAQDLFDTKNVKVSEDGTSKTQMGAVTTRLSQCMDVRFLSHSCFGLQCYDQCNSFDPKPSWEADSLSATQEFPNIL
jgi:hypothetical protein